MMAVTLCFYAFHQYEVLATLLAKLFSEHYLDSEEKTKKHFLPALKTLATTDFVKWHFRDVAIYMFVLLLNRMPENGISVVTAALPNKVHNYTK